MRLYTFTNYYLSSIQQGIQSAHCIADMFVKYDDRAIPERDILHDWAANHKTMVCLNGGNAKGIQEIFADIEVAGWHLELPFASFCEDEQSLSSTMTTCGIVIPASIYEEAASVRAGNAPTIVEPTISSLIAMLNKCGLAK